jgi:hypothetical protein
MGRIGLTPESAAGELRSLQAAAPVRRVGKSSALALLEVCDEWVRHGERERQLKQSTLRRRRRDSIAVSRYAVFVRFCVVLGLKLCGALPMSGVGGR